MIPKFRAWDKKLQTMLDVSLIDFKKGVLVGEHWKFGETNFMSFDEIELMQSTGLFDRNGQEIFEGDIVTDGDVISDIKYHQTLGFYMIGKYGFSVPFGQGVDVEYFEEFAVHVSKTFEVVGNIYENPELLEDKK